MRSREAAKLAKLDPEEAKAVWLEKQPSFSDQLLTSFAGDGEEESSPDAFSRLAAKPRLRMLAAIGEAERLVSGAAIQARCLECTGHGARPRPPLRVRPDRLALAPARRMTPRVARPEDAAAIAEIYAAFVSDSAVSFETEPPDESAIRARIGAGGGLYPWLVGEDEDGTIHGYAYAARFRDRPAYRFAVETSVYLRAGAAGRGLGRRLYEPLLAGLERQGFTQAIAAITLPNAPSVRLHERLGFERAGTYRQVG